MINTTTIWATFYKRNEGSFYDISNNGEVRSYFRGKFHKKKLDINNNGYVSANIKIDGRSKHYLVHRLVAKYFIPNYKRRKFVNHDDGDKNNNSVANLIWCTRSENEIHAWATGLKTKKYGGRNHRAKPVGKYQGNNLVKQYGSLVEAEADGHKADCICAALKRGGTSSGFNWKYLS